MRTLVFGACFTFFDKKVPPINCMCQEKGSAILESLVKGLVIMAASNPKKTEQLSRLVKINTRTVSFMI
jgi:hypothetical protein